jgi:hypothetical protein
MYRFYKTISAAPLKSLLFCPAAAVCLGILGSALRKAAGYGKTTWRGTTYHSTETGRHVQPVIPEAVDAR